MNRTIRKVADIKSGDFFHASSARFISSAFIAFLMFFNTALAGSCIIEDDSKSAEEDYLICTYKQADKRLKAEVSSVITKVQRSRVWLTQPDSAKNFRTHTVSGIEQADLHWRALTKAECEVLVGEQFTGGSGALIGVTTCLISKTEERIKYIKESEIYKWYNN